jgi:hypothetical protein
MRLRQSMFWIMAVERMVGARGGGGGAGVVGRGGRKEVRRKSGGEVEMTDALGS